MNEIGLRIKTENLWGLTQEEVASKLFLSPQKLIKILNMVFKT